jgi:hypothetical protein
MVFRRKSRKILIPDVPPEVKTLKQQATVIASIGIFCISVVLVAVLLVFFDA